MTSPSANKPTSSFVNDRKTYEALHLRDEDDNTAAASTGISIEILAALYKRFQSDCDGLDSTSKGNDDDNVEEVQLLMKLPDKRGERHLKACSSLFSISRKEAAQLTVEALTKMNVVESDNKTTMLASFVGSPALIMSVRDIYYDQRIARLLCLAEVLRIDQDADHPFHSVCREFLDTKCGFTGISSLDNMENFFRMMLARATTSSMTSILFSNEAFFELRDTDENGVGMMSTATKNHWNLFYNNCKDTSEAQCIQERKETLDTLLVLLFSRLDISSAKQCPDGRGLLIFRDLLKAFSSINFYVLESESQDTSQESSSTFTANRLPYLAALLCIESMGLWRSSSKKSNEWVNEHSFLSQIGTDSGAERFQDICLIIASMLEQVAFRRYSLYSSLKITEYSEEIDRMIQKPEALIVLSFGLLLMSARTRDESMLSITKALENMEVFPHVLLERANDAGSFDYFLTLLETLMNVDLFSDCSVQNNNSSNESVIYASISREVLSAALQTTYSFKDGPPDGSFIGNPDDLQMFCNLAYNIHKNQVELCRSFWTYWEGAYCHKLDRLTDHESNDAYTSFELDPLCKLLEMCYSLASSSEATENLSYKLPLVRFLSALACDEDTILCALTVVRENILLPAILSLMKELFSMDSSALAIHNQHLHASFLLDLLVKFSMSENHDIHSILISALDEIAALGDFPSTEDISGGAQALCSTTVHNSSIYISGSIWSLLASLIKNFEYVPIGWVNVISRKYTDSIFSKLKKYEGVKAELDISFFRLSFAAVSITETLTSRLAVISTKSSLKVTECQNYLSNIVEGVFGVCNLLIMLYRSSTLDKIVCHQKMQLQMRCLQSVRKALEVIGLLSRRQEMNECSFLFKNARDSFLLRLASDTNLHECIMSTAAFPAASALRSMLITSTESTLHSNGSSFDDNKYGLWSYLRLGSSSAGATLSDPRFRVNKILAGSINMSEGILGSYTDPSVLINQTNASLSLILTWANTVEEVIEERYGCSIELVAHTLEDSERDIIGASSNDIIISTKEEMQRELVSLSPSNLLVSQSISPSIAALQHEGESNIYINIGKSSFDESNGIRISKSWSEFGVSNLSLIWQYIGNFSLSSLSCQAIDCVKLCMRHQNFDSLSFDSVVKEGIFSKHGLSMMHLAIFSNSPLTEILIEKENCEALVSALTLAEASIKSRSISLNNCIETAAEAAQCIALLWERVRTNAVHKEINQNPTNLCKVIDILVKDEGLWNACCGIVDNAAFHLGDLVSMSKDDLLLRSVLLRLVSSCVRILTVEIHASFGELPPKLRNFLDVALQEKKYDSWTERYVRFDGDLLSDFGETVRGIFEKEHIVLSPTIFVSRTLSLSGQVYDLELASKFLSENLVLNGLVDANASWNLTYSQSRTIRSWKRYMDVCILRSHRSPLSQPQIEAGFPVTPKISVNSSVSPSPLLLGKKSMVDENISHVVPVTPKVLKEAHAGSSFAGDYRSYSMIRHFLQALVSHGNHIHEIISLGGVAASAASVKVAIELAEALVSMLHHQLVDVVVKSLDPSSSVTEPRKETSLRKEQCSELLSILQIASNRLFFATKPSISDQQNFDSEIGRRQSYMLACSLRLHLLTAFLLLIRARDSHDNSPKLPSQMTNELFRTPDKKYIDTRLSVVDLVCETLQLMSYSKQGWAMTPKGMFPYTFDTENNDSAQKSLCLIPVKILHVCFKLLQVLLPKQNLGFLYSSDLAAAFERGKLRSTLSEHINVGSRVVEECQSQNREVETDLVTKMKESIQIVRVALDFISLSSGYEELVKFLIKDGFIFRLLSNNRMLQEATTRWDSLPETLCHLRGYVSSQENSIPLALSCNGKMTFIEDEIHKMWLVAIRIVGTILRVSLKFSNSSLVSPCLNDIVSFLRTYEIALLSGIMVHRKKERENTSIMLTKNGLRETSHCLFLLKELCSKPCLRHFMSAAPELLDRLLVKGLGTMRDLTAFLQSTTVARDLFAAVLKVQALESNTASNDDPTMQDILSISIFNSALSAKHDALMHARFANSCCISMTQDDTNSSQLVEGNTTVERSKKTSPSPGDLAQNINVYRNSVDNAFVRKIEAIASQCVLNMLTILSRVHPACSSWIYFKSGELSGANLSKLVSRGTTVAVLSQVDKSLSLAKVLNQCDSYITVQYNNKEKSTKVERILGSQIVGIQDSASRSCLFKFDFAMASSPESLNAEASLGHLILQLRWCKQYWMVEESQRSLVKSIANQCASLLTLEFILRKEALGKGIASNELSTEKQKLLNFQLFELFDESMDMNTCRVSNSNPLKNILGDGLLKLVRSNLMEFLHAAKVEYESNRGKTLRSPRNTWSRRQRSTNISGAMQTPKASTGRVAVSLQTPFFTPKN